MKKAYVTVEGFSEKAKKTLESAGIELTINNENVTPNEEELGILIKQYDIIITGVSCKFTKKIFEQISTPKIIATVSVGVDHIDKRFFESPLVRVIKISKANAISVAEHIFCLILALNKRIYESNNLIINRNGCRKNLHEKPEEIFEKTLGLIGCGNITKEVVKIAKAFNLKIKCYTKNPQKHKNMLKQGVEFLTLDEILSESDIINVSLPLTEETKGLISRKKIELIKHNATFISTSRAEIIDLRALINYADKYETFYVGLDIDLDRYKELLCKYRKNVIVSPHTAGVSKQSIEKMDVEIANRIVDLVNFEK